MTSISAFDKIRVVHTQPSSFTKSDSWEITLTQKRRCHLDLVILYTCKMLHPWLTYQGQSDMLRAKVSWNKAAHSTHMPVAVRTCPTGSHFDLRIGHT